MITRITFTFTYPLRQGHWGTTDDFTTNFLHFSFLRCHLGLDLSIHWCCFFTSCFCLTCRLPPFTVPCKFWTGLMNGRHVHTTSVCVSLPLSSSFVICIIVYLRDMTKLTRSSLSRVQDKNRTVYQWKNTEIPRVKPTPAKPWTETALLSKVRSSLCVCGCEG